MKRRNPLTKSLSFQAMRTFSFACQTEPAHELRAAVRWMIDFLDSVEKARIRKRAEDEIAEKMKAVTPNKN